MAVDLKRVPRGDRAAVRKLTRQSEAAFQKQVIGLAKSCGWLVHAERPAVNQRGQWRTPIQGDAGFPDLVLAHWTLGIIFAELKSAKGKPTDDQALWLETLAKGARTFCWRPSDWPEIEAILTGTNA